MKLIYEKWNTKEIYTFLLVRKNDIIFFVGEIYIIYCI